jgi:hypothetical protein
MNNDIVAGFDDEKADSLKIRLKKRREPRQRHRVSEKQLHPCSDPVTLG